MKKIKLILLTLSLGLMGYSPSISQTIGGVELPDWPETPKENLCRCNGDGCYGGNLISFRPRCGQGDCSASASNCPS